MYLYFRSIQAKRQPFPGAYGKETISLDLDMNAYYHELHELCKLNALKNGRSLVFYHQCRGLRTMANKSKRRLR